MREISRFVLELDLNEGKEFEKESGRLKISKIDLFRLMWKIYKEQTNHARSK